MKRWGKGVGRVGLTHAGTLALDGRGGGGIGKQQRRKNTRKMERNRHGGKGKHIPMEWSHWRRRSKLKLLMVEWAHSRRQLLSSSIPLVG
jgi:hypothetical protein